MKQDNNKKITIGLFGDSFFPMADGVIMVMDNYARRLCKYANVIVFVPEYLTKKYDDSIFPYKVVRCHSVKVPFLDYSVSIPKLDAKFMRKLNKYKLDIVHVHSPFTLGRAGLAYAKRHHVPCIATMHSQFKQDFQRAVKSDVLATKLNNNLMKFFNKCDECWAVNSEVARIYYEDYHYKCLPKVMNNATEMLPVKSEKEAINYIIENLYIPRPYVCDAVFFPGESHENNVVNMLRTCKYSLDICMFTMTNDKLFEAVEECWNANVDVRIITDDECVKQKGSDVFKLAAIGVPVKTDSSAQYHMHHKFVVIDKKVLTASLSHLKAVFFKYKLD